MDETAPEPGTADPLAFVGRELGRGAKSVVVPKRVWRVSPPAGRGSYLALRGVSGTTVDFSGGELRGLAATNVFSLEGCEGVTIRNVALDFDPLPFTQAEIVEADGGGNWTVRTLSGYPAPGEELLGEVWPLQVYDRASLELKNPMRGGAGFRIEKTGDATYRVSGGENRTGCVGDYVACYSTPGGRAFEEHFCEADEYRRCRVVRRAPEDDFAPRAVRRLRSGGHDAFMSRRAAVGPKILGCTAQYHCDDAVNVSGNRFSGCVVHVGGTAAHRRPIPPEACRNVRTEGNLFQRRPAQAPRFPKTPTPQTEASP